MHFVMVMTGESALYTTRNIRDTSGNVEESARVGVHNCGMRRKNNKRTCEIVAAPSVGWFLPSLLSRAGNGDSASARIIP